MKRISTLFFALVFFQLNAQLSVGPELGMNLIKVDKQDVGDNYQPAWYFGGALEYRISDLFTIQSGVYFSQKRQSYSVSDTSLSDIFSLIGTSSISGVDLNTYTTTYSRQSQSFIEIPLTASVKWENLHVFAGAYAGIMISSNRKKNTVSETPFMSILQLDSLIGLAGGGPGVFLTSLLPKAHEEVFSETSDNTNLNSFDYGLKAGIGYQKDKIGFYVSYNFGLADFRKNRGENDVQKHHYFQFSIRYLFDIRKRGVSSVR